MPRLNCLALQTQELRLKIAVPETVIKRDEDPEALRLSGFLFNEHNGFQFYPSLFLIPAEAAARSL